jgi:type VI secretion system protein ImpI
MPQAKRPNAPDFLDYASGIPAAPVEAPVFEPASSGTPDDWMRGRVEPPPPPEPPAMAPTPRRPAQRPAPASPPPVAEVAPFTVSPPAPGLVVEAGPNDAELLARIARAAGIDARAFGGRDAGAIADEIGVVLRLLAQNLTQMLASRSETKGLIRSANRTMIRAHENNPLKFTASPEEALSIMFGPPTRNYLGAQAAVERGFADLKAHQIQTFGAMQAALEALFEDLAPDKIDSSVEAERGLGGLVGSRKAKLWDVYAERWRAKTRRSDGRLVEAFMALFAESYDRLQKKEP